MNNLGFDLVMNFVLEYKITFLHLSDSNSKMNWQNFYIAVIYFHQGSLTEGEGSVQLTSLALLV
jgi:hypothetical protein